jgi:hypothetical protein
MHEAVADPGFLAVNLPVLLPSVLDVPSAVLCSVVLLYMLSLKPSCTCFSVPCAAAADVSVLADRLSDMEGLMRELAQAQVANTAVLQQIGGRLPSPVPPSPDSHISSSHAAPAAFIGQCAAAGDYRASPGVLRSIC